MKDVTYKFNQQFEPYKALLILKDISVNDPGAISSNEVFVQSFDIGKTGNPINAHPLSIKEMAALSELLGTSKDLTTSFLQSRGILADEVLYLNPNGIGEVIWYTIPHKAEINFSEELSLPSGYANVPGLIWKASKTKLYVYAFQGKTKPTISTPLYHAPFYNIYKDGLVCMGNVELSIKSETRLEDFILQWQDRFWKSYFVHLMDNFNPVKGIMWQLWKNLVKSGNEFPADVLINNSLTLKSLLL